jgi:uncharacterized protein (TIGR00730 family)
MSRLCVFCGSNAGAAPAFAEAAARLGSALASREIGLGYGGGNVGLMGILADSVIEHGGEVIGVIPEFLERAEVAHTGLTELHVVGSMHERKALMATLADGFISLPGGFGTVDELAEALTWTQLGLQAKPVVLLDVDGFWEPLVRFFDAAVDTASCAPAWMLLRTVPSTTPSRSPRGPVPDAAQVAGPDGTRCRRRRVRSAQAAVCTPFD